MAGEITKNKSTVITKEEADKLIWEELLNWMNSGDNLPPEIREVLLQRIKDLRLRMQVLFLEIQRRFVHGLAMDIEFEEELRREIRRGLPYMSVQERNMTLKYLIETNRPRLDRLETQLGGFDFLNAIEVSVQTMDESKVPVPVSDKVRSIPPARRRYLKGLLDDVIKELNAADADQAIAEIEKIENESGPDTTGN